jgi:hypothetical protein
VLRYFLTEGRTAALLLARAELAGLEPERMDLPGMGSSLRLMSQRFARLQSVTLPHGPRADPAVLAIAVGAGVFGFLIMKPWLMASVGLKPDDDRLDDIIEIVVAFVGLGTGLFKQPCGETPPAAGFGQMG